ncbi:hypothetical protein F2Q70_00025551 [Brassica cretica]|uniref:Uncharacterized protein n=1 Tax=Brassica cretica TaxID=69181 RepID=A0A8S9LAT4_BRACR|nr:hypothetical protein F2Q70_00025551 [Brassica cretica]
MATMMPVTVNVNLFATHMPNTSPALTYAACYNTSWILRSLCLFYYCKSEMNFAIITLCLDLLFIDVTPRNPLFCKDYASILLKFMFSDVWPNTKKVGDKPLLSVSIFVQGTATRGGCIQERLIRNFPETNWRTEVNLYSYVTVGSSGDDLDAMAEPLPRVNKAGGRVSYMIKPSTRLSPPEQSHPPAIISFPAISSGPQPCSAGQVYPSHGFPASSSTSLSTSSSADQLSLTVVHSDQFGVF